MPSFFIICIFSLRVLVLEWFRNPCMHAFFLMCTFILAVCCEPQRRKLRRLHGKPEISFMFPQFYEVSPCMGFATRTHRGLESSPPSKEKNDHMAIVDDMNKPGLANESWGLLLSGVKVQRQYKVVARHVPYLVYALDLVSGRSVVPRALPAEGRIGSVLCFPA